MSSNLEKGILNYSLQKADKINIVKKEIEFVNFGHESIMVLDNENNFSYKNGVISSFHVHDSIHFNTGFLTLNDVDGLN